MTTTDPILIDALIAADYLEEHCNFPEAVAILRQAAFVHLLPFCDEEQHWKWSLCEPFVQGGYVYATDGKIAIRIPTRRPDTFHEGRFPKMGETFDKLLRAYTRDAPGDLGWLPWPTKPVFVETETDAKTGIACPICRGATHYYADGDAVTCVYCDATGYVERWDNVDTGKSIIAGRYWQLISRLPNVWYLERMREDDPIWFRFAGGDGLLMTIKQE